MDAKPAPSLKLSRWLALLCAVVAAAGAAWAGWDMFGPARRPMIQGWDDSFYYFWLPSVVIDHDIDFSNQIEQCRTLNADMRDVALTAQRTPTGLVADKYPPGWAIGSAPFFLAARIVMPRDTTGFEPPYQVAVWCGQLLYAVAGLWFAIKIVARLFPPETARIAVLAGWLASPLVYYQSARLAMSHSQVFVLAMAVFWLAQCIDNGDTRWRTWLLLGFSSALLVVTRNVAIVYLLYPGYVLVRRLRKPSATGWCVLGAAAPAAAQLLAWKVLYGSWFAYSYGGERFDFAHLHLGAILFSPRHGWFYWHPLLLAGILAFVVWGWRRRDGRAWLASLAAIAVLNAAWPTWWLGSSFGYRGFEVATLFAMIGLAALIEWVRTIRWRQRALTGLIGVAIVWNLALFALFLGGRISREAPVTYATVAHALSGWVSGAR